MVFFFYTSGNRHTIVANNLHVWYIFNMKHHDSIHILRAHHIRATPRKKAVLREILASDHPLGAAELHRRASAFIKLDLATVYRSLEIFMRHGIIREIAYENGAQAYEMACVHNPAHPHFKCLKCHRIFCLGFFRSGDTEPLLSRFSGSRTITDISVTLSGICEKCIAGNELP